MILFAVVVILLIAHFCYYKLTRFTKRVTIRKKYKKSVNNFTTLYIVDTYNEEFVVGSCLWEAMWESDTLWKTIKEGGIYSVVGYGKRIRYINTEPIVYGVE